MAEISIDGKLFQERISHFANAWKADKRTGDGVFAGVSSIVVLMGKVEDEPDVGKSNAMHVRQALSNLFLRRAAPRQQADDCC